MDPLIEYVPRRSAPARVRAGRALVLLTTVLLAGCGTLQPITDSSRYYTLTPALAAGAPTPERPGTPVRIGIRVELLADYLRRPPIATRVGAHELRFANDHRWAEHVDEAVERTLALGLEQRLAIAAAPVSGGTAAGAPVLINVAIAACEGTTAGDAVFDGYWKIIASGVVEPAASGHFRRTRAGWDGHDFGQLASLLGALVDELAAELAPAAQAAAAGIAAP